MMKRIAITTITATMILLIFFSYANNEAKAAENCTGITTNTKIWWDGVELRVGQIGRLEVLKDTDLYKLEDNQETYSRTLKAGEKYRIYAFKPGRLSVGGGYYVDRDSRVHYETPSKSKLALVACKKQEAEMSALSIKIGESKSSIEQKLGQAKRTSLNEYGINWNTHHNQYDHFYMVGYERDKVIQIYSNDESLYVNGVHKGLSGKEVVSLLGSPIKGIIKGNVNYLITNNEEEQTFYKSGNYITVFYDIHKGSKVTGIQVVTSSLEQKKDGRFGNQSFPLQQAFELQMFDLINAARVDNGLSPLNWGEEARSSSRKHSKDMAINNYFNHTNLQNESPFDRMDKEGIRYWAAGENLAMGHPSSIFAHEALMNSIGHRKNILQEEFTHVGVGVQFQQDTQRPYYTQNYFKPF
ncbi:CAP-associated domain-containing protein [Cytobacillus sp. FJAT-54145]|uniref:CAP-associated domain-containing protein n=1 Tax=Cytobacillus spartinae TaxID=3299023 RepID=A0ABW6KBU0_9BACI